jgi:hypothetical protein
MDNKYNDMKAFVAAMQREVNVYEAKKAEGLTDMQKFNINEQQMLDDKCKQIYTPKNLVLSI